MVTYAELFQFCALIVGVITLVYQIIKKEVTALASPSAVTSIATEGLNRLTGSTLHPYCNRDNRICQAVAAPDVGRLLPQNIRTDHLAYLRHICIPHEFKLNLAESAEIQLQFAVHVEHSGALYGIRLDLAVR